MSNQYITIAASQTNQRLHAGNNDKTGTKGDIIERLVISAITSATATVTLIDGSTSIVITAANTPIGVYTIDLGVSSQTGGWGITTGAGASVIAIGAFA